MQGQTGLTSFRIKVKDKLCPHREQFFDNIFPMALTIADLRRHAVASSLFPPTTLKRALDRIRLRMPTHFPDRHT